ncbi:MAG TPA: GNAT family N-acetyltransferase [Actinomycetes bacterium]|nr:GNAT family N-acetyltransferase [Actinomycetes bacterium]
MEVDGREREPGNAATLEVRPLALADPAVAAAWRRLQAVGGVGSPFLVWELFSALADVPELSGGTRVLIVANGGCPVGLLPVEPLDGPFGLPTLGLAPRWLGADHLDVVAEPRHRPEVAAAVAAHLAARSDWQMLDLDGLDRSGALSGQIRRILRPPRYLPLPVLSVPVPYVLLGDAAGSLRSNAIKEAARKLRAVERDGGGFSVVRSPDGVVDLLRDLIGLHNRRLGPVSEVFATEARRRFHLLAARRLAEAGMARIYRVEADGVSAGLQYDFVLGDRVYFYQSGIEPTAGRSPGLVVLGGAICSAAEEGFGEFDLLRGDEPYKLRFATGTRQDSRLLVFRLTPRTAMRGGAWASARGVRYLAVNARARLARSSGRARVRPRG